MTHLGREQNRVQRGDIDGLRALAVLSVMFHHYLVPGFRGGFVGVDVFFVISGSLIAAHIDGDIDAGRFSLLAFYERRIRRILPALAVMYVLFLVLAYKVYFPPDLHFQTRLAAYVIPFLANYALYQNAGIYGGEFAAHIGLLHTWSLAVEEQFYLTFPLLMMVISRLMRGRYAAVLWPMALASFVLCVVVTYVAPSAAFYLTPFRAWELLTGALLAVARLSPPRDTRVRTGAALLGLLLIAGADLILSNDTPYPGAWALVPCAGAVAILYASCDRTVPVGKVLDNPIMRKVGLWSYSLYLVHWPVLVLAEYYFFDPLSLPLRCILLASTFLFGALSWHYVEQPFRGPRAPLSRPTLYGIAAASGVALVLAALVLHRIADPRRYSAREHTQFPSDTADQMRCRNTFPEDAQAPVCKLGDKSAPVEAILWGDSHALAILPAVNAVYAQHHRAAIFAEEGGCPPLLGVHVRDFSTAESRLFRSWRDAHGHGRSERCKRHTEAVLNWIVHNHVGTVILAAHWIAYTEDKHSRRLTDAQSPENYSMLDNAAVFARGLDSLLAALEGEHVQVILLDDVPQSVVYVPYALASAQRLRLDREFRIRRVTYDAQQLSATAIFARLQKRYGFRVLKPQDFLCAGGMCSIARNDAPLYTDREHLSELGAMISEPALEAIWDDKAARGRALHVIVKNAL
ncbi:MAG TPA: acyltransferase family protein [Steroidobacteraceae bacterium]|jgi:peptidoglycan/LPS O-acetylase OafA/YrhL|nr:acyltransferase family protein [Steroidobacteraceae bacterium]